MQKKFNYLAASILVIIANIPFYLILGFSGDKKIPVIIPLNIGIVGGTLFLTPVVTVLFLRKFSNGVNLRNGLILGAFVSVGCLILDSLVIGFIFGLGLSFLKNWLFAAVYFEILVLAPLTGFFIGGGLGRRKETSP